MALTDGDVNRVEGIAELKVRQYFDTFLKETFPQIMASHVDGCKHGKRVSNLIWAIIGSSLTSGGVTFTIMKLLGN